MEIAFAKTTDAPLIHDLMIRAFIEYKDEVPPSSALDETVLSVSAALENGEQAIISYMGDEPVGMVRFHVKEDCIYFYRLSVAPEKRGQGIAKEVLNSLEEYAIEFKKTMIQCKVRMTIPKNIALYQSLGYKIFDEEIVYRPNGITLNVVAMMKQL